MSSEYNYNLETRIEMFRQGVQQLIHDNDISVGIAWMVLENLSKECHEYHDNVVKEDLQQAEYYLKQQKEEEENNE